MDIVLDDRKAGVSPLKSGGNTQQNCGVGYVIIPPGSDREEFVSTCFRKNFVAIIDDVTGAIMYNCPITTEVLANLKFPTVEGEKGSPVVWVSQPYNNKPIVVGTFERTTQPSVREDECIEVHKSWAGGSIDITGNPKDGTLNVSVTGEPFSTFIVKTLGNDKSLLNVHSSGNVAIGAAKRVEVVACDNMEFCVKDVERGNSSGIAINKEETILSNTYGEDDKKQSVKTTINALGVVTDIAIGKNDYKQVIDADKCETTIADCKVTLQKEKIVIQQGDAIIEVVGGKIGLVNQLHTFKKIMQSVLDMVKNLTVATPQGQSSTPLPPTIVAITKIEKELGEFFSR